MGVGVMVNINIKEVVRRPNHVKHENNFSGVVEINGELINFTCPESATESKESLKAYLIKLLSTYTPKPKEQLERKTELEGVVSWE